MVSVCDHRNISRYGNEISFRLTPCTKRRFARATGVRSQVAPVEVVWVLGRSYGVEREQMKDLIDSMIRTKELVVEGTDTVRKALRVFVASAKADLADCLIERSGYVAECEYTVTEKTSTAQTS